MGRAKARKKRQHSMPLGRLHAVRRIEQKRALSPDGQGDHRSQIDPSTSDQIRQLRKLGLSVSDHATPQKIRALQEEFELVAQYVRDVFVSLYSHDRSAPPDDQVTRFVAMLFADGKLVVGIATAQRDRNINQVRAKDLSKTSPFNQVAKRLQQTFGQPRAKRSWWLRLWRM